MLDRLVSLFEASKVGSESEGKLRLWRAILPIAVVCAAVTDASLARLWDGYVKSQRSCEHDERTVAVAFDYVMYQSVSATEAEPAHLFASCTVSRT